MSRQNVYLGTRVPDIGKPGLDKIAEVEWISRAIYEDYIRRRISYNKAIRRLNLLSLVIVKKEEFDEKRKKHALNIVNFYRHKVMKARMRVRYR